MTRPDILNIEYFKQMANIIAVNIPVERIVLFGSQATGKIISESDVDLLIIQKDNESNRAVRRKVDALFRGRNFPLDIIVCRKEEYEMNLQAGHPLFIEIVRDGKILYE
jgi:predicted nucleotidyltransferase